MKDFIKRIRDDWEFLVVAITTSVVGINFLVNPNLLEDRSTYAFIMNVLDDAVFSIPIVIMGIVGVILFILNKRQFRSGLLMFYQFVWMILFLAYLWRAIVGFPNSSWVSALALNVVIFFIALWDGGGDGR